LGSPVTNGWQWIDQRCRRRAAAADQWWRGRVHSNSGEDRGGTGQCVARTASQGLGKGLRRLVGSGITRGAELADGCPAAAAGETTPASWRLEQANKRAQELQGVLKEWGAARVGEEKQAGVEFTVWHPWRTAAARCSRGEKTGRLYIPAQGG
jgi:hypothetical protein